MSFCSCESFNGSETAPKDFAPLSVADRLLTKGLSGLGGGGGGSFLPVFGDELSFDFTADDSESEFKSGALGDAIMKLRPLVELTPARKTEDEAPGCLNPRFESLPVAGSLL